MVLVRANVLLAHFLSDSEFIRYIPGGGMRDIQQVLMRWGGWAREHPSMGYSHIAAGFKGLLPHTAKNRLSCCDEDGLAVDRAVARLQAIRQPEELELILRHYVYGESKSAIARGWKCSEGRVRQQMQIAEGFIDGCLSHEEIKLQMEKY